MFCQQKNEVKKIRTNKVVAIHFREISQKTSTYFYETTKDFIDLITFYDFSHGN